MKQVPLIRDWSVVLHVRDDGERVGAILRAKTVQADFLCVVANERAFAIVRFPAAPPGTQPGRSIYELCEPWRASPLDLALHRTLEETLSREFGMPTQLLVTLSGGKASLRFIMVPPAAE